MSVTDRRFHLLRGMTSFKKKLLAKIQTNIHAMWEDGEVDRSKLQLTEGSKRNAVVVIINGEDKILLLRRSRYIGASGCWNFPGGRIEDGEPPDVAAKREVAEETGVILGDIESNGTFYTKDGRTIYCYKVKYDNTFRPVLNFEHDDWRWVTLDEIKDLKRLSQTYRMAVTAFGLPDPVYRYEID